MKSKKFLFIILVNMVLGIFTTQVSAQETSITTYAIQDTYISEQNPTSNYGSDTSFIVGDNGLENEAYFKFDVSEISGDISKATFMVYISNLNNPFNVEITFIPDYWEEGTLDWNSRPGKSDVFGEFLVDSSMRKYTIDMTLNIQNFVGHGQSELALCLSNIYLGSNWCQGWTKEMDPGGVNCPQIQWEVNQSFNFPWYILIIIIGIIAAVNIIIPLVIVKKRKGRGSGSKDDASLRMYEDEPMIGGRYASIKRASAAAATEEKICLFCGYKNRSRTGYCRNCGNPLSG